MNKTSRTDEPEDTGPGFNQSPNPLSNDLVTNQDLNGRVNTREHLSPGPGSGAGADGSGPPIADRNLPAPDSDPDGPPADDAGRGGAEKGRPSRPPVVEETIIGRALPGDSPHRAGGSSPPGTFKNLHARLKHVFVTFGKFIGPGFLVSVAYIDPGNYSTDIAAGASYRFRLLFIILFSNLIAIFLQSLSIKLGTVTGLNLAEACRAFLPRWLNIFLYIMAEAAIIATDIAEVIGTAIALNLLIPQIPLVAGCALSILDVMLILLFYRPNGNMKGLRLFEFFVMLLVLAVVICFCIQLSLIENTSVGEVFHGYVPNDAITESQGLLQACGILGATVMPHSLYLGSGMVQSRLKEYDADCGLLPLPETSRSDRDSFLDEKAGIKTYYVPSLPAIKHSLKYSYAETAISLFTFALFVNSAILILAGASLYGNSDALDADIFGIHGLLSSSISPAAGTIFALALLFSGVSAGIVCTISGQMVCEGALRWRMKPWVRRLVTRSISVTPSIIIAGAAGREKLNDALNGSQVALSIVLPFVSAPLIWFTCRDAYMRVRPGQARYMREEGRDLVDISARVSGVASIGPDEEEDRGGSGELVSMTNSWWVSILGLVIWLVIVVMNVANIVLLGLGDA